MLAAGAAVGRLAANFVLLTIVAAFTASHVQAQSWIYSGNMGSIRTGHTATLLANGKVLVTGGYGTQGLRSAELYDPATGSWTATGSMNSVRWSHAAARLTDGRVLVAGGYDGTTWLRTAEIYDPAAGTWAPVANLNHTRISQTLTVLNNGKVLMAGGSGDASIGEWYLLSTELFDPATGTWTPTGNLSHGRYVHTAHLLSSGKVIVIGGYSLAYGVLSSTETYDPATGTWSFSGNMHTQRYRHPSVVLSSGEIMVAGGAPDTGGAGTTSAEVYNPATQTWTVTGSLTGARFANGLNLLPNGKVITAGGYRYGEIGTSELYDPTTGTWSPASPLNNARIDATYTTLPSGTVLAAGGGVDINGSTPLRTSETYSIGDVDATPPVLTLPTNQVLEATSATGAVAVFAASATDNVAVVSLTYDHQSGSVFPLGVTTVRVAAADAAGNSTSGTFTITVRDTTPPVITSLSPSLATLTPANHKLVAITVGATATDAVDVPSLRIIAVESNELDDGLGDGDTPNDVQITGDLKLNLRAERSGSGSGRLYTITVRATDAAGNYADAKTTVTVPRDQR